MTTVTAGPPELIYDYWTAALKFYGLGRTAAEMRAIAADPEMTRGLALLTGATEEQERVQAAGIADCIGIYAEAGLTREQAYFLAGLDKTLGPYTESAALSAVA